MLVMSLSGTIVGKLTTQTKTTEKEDKSEKFFVIDDTINEISGKLVEKA